MVLVILLIKYIIRYLGLTNNGYICIKLSIRKFQKLKVAYSIGTPHMIKIRACTFAREKFDW